MRRSCHGIAARMVTTVSDIERTKNSQIPFDTLKISLCSLAVPVAAGTDKRFELNIAFEARSEATSASV